MADPAQKPLDVGGAAAPGYDLAAIYQKLQDQGQAEVADAQAKAAQMRDSGRAASIAASFAGPEAGQKMRQQVLDESQIPLQEVAQRHAAREQAVREAVQQGQVAAQGFQNQQLLKLMDPKSEASAYVREQAAKMGAPMPDTMSAHSASLLNPVLKEIVDSYSTRTGAKEKEVETGIKAAAAPVDRAKVAAETGKTEAETRKLALETGGQVAPGWVPTGAVGATDKDRADFSEAWRSNDAVHKTVDEIKKLMGDANFVSDPKKRAQIQPRVATMLASLKGQLSMRQLAGPELKFLETLSGDPTKITPGNILGWTKNGVRLDAFKELADRELETQAAGKFARAGAASSASKPPAPSGPEAPAKGAGAGGDADALNWAKAHPQDPRSAKILIRLRTKGALAGG